MTVSGKHLAVLKGSTLLSLPALVSSDYSTAQSTQLAQLTDSCFLLLLSNERLLPGGGEHTGHPDFTKPQCLLPSHDARWLCAAGGQCVVCKLHHVTLIVALQHTV